MSICVLLDYIEINVNFDDPSYNIKESDGVVEISLSLDKPSPCCLHVLVEFVNGTAIGELYVLYICMYMYVINTVKSINMHKRSF